MRVLPPYDENGSRGMKMRIRIVQVMLAFITCLAGCEGVITGTEVARLPLLASDDGGYLPVKFDFAPDMSPVAVNFRADFSQNSDEFGKWNTYRTVLSKDGKVIVARSININHPVSNRDDSAPPPTQAIHTLFIFEVQSAGLYELKITPVNPVEITLSNARADARRNVQRPPA
jgi:hypothetical protein